MSEVGEAANCKSCRLELLLVFFTPRDRSGEFNDIKVLGSVSSSRFFRDLL